jgi:hypothetical protein
MSATNKKTKPIMKTQKFLLATAAAVLLAVASSRLSAADAAKEVTLNGNMVCAKCVLHETKECQNVLQVQQDGKTVNYYLAKNGVSDNFHDQICGTQGEKATATGAVSEKDGKEILTASKIEPVK